jgi:hypothetical protein
MDPPEIEVSAGSAILQLSLNVIALSADSACWHAMGIATNIAMRGA